MANLIPIILKELGLEENEKFHVKFEGEIMNDTYYINKEGLFFEGESSCINNLVLSGLVKGDLEVVKIKHLSDDEKVILKNVNKDFKWIARDKNGLFIFEDKPERHENFREHSYWCECEYLSLNAFKHLFQCIQWSDSEPTLIEDLLKE